MLTAKQKKENRVLCDRERIWYNLKRAKTYARDLKESGERWKIHARCRIEGEVAILASRAPDWGVFIDHLQEDMPPSDKLFRNKRDAKRKYKSAITMLKHVRDSVVLYVYEAPCYHCGNIYVWVNKDDLMKSAFGPVKASCTKCNRHEKMRVVVMQI